MQLNTIRSVFYLGFASRFTFYLWVKSLKVSVYLIHFS